MIRLAPSRSRGKKLSMPRCFNDFRQKVLFHSSLGNRRMSTASTTAPMNFGPLAIFPATQSSDAHLLANNCTKKLLSGDHVTTHSGCAPIDGTVDSLYSTVVFVFPTFFTDARGAVNWTVITILAVYFLPSSRPNPLNSLDSSNSPGLSHFKGWIA
jgi:hypothetical protein